MRSLAIAATAMLASCDNAPATRLLSQSDDTQAAEIQLLKTQISALQKELLDVRIKSERQTWSNFKTNEKGYANIDASGMPIVVSLGDVTESASGSKVKLRIGNPTTADITRLRLDLSYGKASEDGLLTAPIRNKVEIVTSGLPAGRWTDVTVGLPDAPPRDVGIVRINGAVAEALKLGVPEAEPTS